MLLRRFWLHSKANLWPIPVLIVGAESALALALVELDGRSRPVGPGGGSPHLPALGPDAAFNLLNLIAGSMMTVAATVFALTIVALTLASTQFTPRVMGNFMRSRVTQVALGVFLGIYAYCMLVMRQVRSGGDAPFVPASAMLGAVVLAFVGIGFLIFFILYLFSSIQASVIAYRATTDSIALVDRLMPEPLGKDGDEDPPGGPAPVGMTTTPHDVVSRRIGFIQSVDEDALFALACRRGTLLRVRRGSGSFVVAGEAVASLADPPDEATARAVEAAFTIGAYRTVDQDIAYGIWELVDMALKALSAAVNDTSTGVLCVNYLTAIMAHAVQRRSPPALRLQGGSLRLVRAVPTFASLLDQAFDQIRHNATDNVAVIVRLLHALETLARLTTDARRRADLLRHVCLVVDVAERSIRSPHEREEANAYLARMRQVWADDWPGLRLSDAPPGVADR